MLEQQHLNLVVSVMRRLQSVCGNGSGGETPVSSYANSSNASNHNKQIMTAAACPSDKLATLMQYLLNCLLTLSLPIPGMSVSYPIPYSDSLPA